MKKKKETKRQTSLNLTLIYSLTSLKKEGKKILVTKINKNLFSGVKKKKLLWDFTLSIPRAQKDSIITYPFLPSSMFDPLPPKIS